MCDARARMRARASTPHGGEATARREKIKCQPEILLEPADDKANEAKEDNANLEEALIVELPFEILQAQRREHAISFTGSVVPFGFSLRVCCLQKANAAARSGGGGWLRRAAHHAGAAARTTHDTQPRS